MKKVFFLLLSLGYLATATAQETTMKMENAEPAANEVGAKHRVLVVPFDSRLYMSSIDANIAQRTGLTHRQIKARMRHGLNLTVFGATRTHMPAISILDSEDPEVAKDLGYIYNSIGYRYEELPAEAEAEEVEAKTGAQKLMGKFTRLTQRDPDNDYIEPERNKVEDIEEHPVERYMNTTIINPNMLTYLHQKYETDIVLFINQLDISNEVGTDSYSYAKNANQRRIKVHYSIYDVKGVEIYSGASIVYFSSKVNDMNTIVKDYFAAAAENIASHLPDINLDETANSQGATNGELKGHRSAREKY